MPILSMFRRLFRRLFGRPASPIAPTPVTTASTRLPLAPEMPKPDKSPDKSLPPPVGSGLRARLRWLYREKSPCACRAELTFLVRHHMHVHSRKGRASACTTMRRALRLDAPVRTMIGGAR